MSSQIKGALYVLGAMFLFSLMSAVVKLVGGEVSAAGSVFARGLVGTVIILMYAGIKKVDLRGRRKGLLALRALSGTIALMLVFYAFTRIPTASAMLLNQMTPVFMIPLAVLFLGERISWLHVLLALVAIAGAAIVLRPQINGVGIPGLLALGSAFFAAIAYLLVRKLTATENSLTIVFWFAAVSTVAALPLAIDDLAVPTIRAGLLLILVGILGLTGQVLLTMGYRLGEAGKLAVVGSTGAIFCALLDITVFGYTFDILTAAGGLLVIVSCALIQVLKDKNRRVRQR
jgi:drug/metabolite transporter (DMT)-like permease